MPIDQHICHSINSTVDYQARHFEINFQLKPYNGSTPLSFQAAQQTLTLQYTTTTLYTEREGKATTALDPLNIRAATGSDPVLPVPSLTTKNQISVDDESLVLNSDGR